MAAPTKAKAAGPRPLTAQSPAGYFETMRIPMLSGRGCTTDDTPDGAPVAIVSQALATKLFASADPIGRRIHIGGSEDKRAIEIVGVAGNILDDWFSSRFGPMIYVSMPQRPSFIVNVVARTSGDPARLSDELRAALRSIDPAQPPVHVMTMNAMVRERTTGLRMIGTMMGSLGALAMVLAAIGLYSLMLYSVVQRRHEIGVRMALGASRGGIVRLTIRRAWWLTAAGATLRPRPRRAALRRAPQRFLRHRDTGRAPLFGRDRDGRSHCARGGHDSGATEPRRLTR